MPETDIVITGGGIVGLATAYQLLRRRPTLSLTVVEKESDVAGHQTGHNSGVLHSGIYYRPGSLKAENCREGKKAMEAFCSEHGIAFDICGKVIVAVDESELPAMERILERGQKNGVVCERIDQARLRELEPHASGIQAIHVPEAGIVNYREVCTRLAEIIREHNCQILTNTRVKSLQSNGGGVTVETNSDTITTEYAINCAGLHSDRVARASGQTPDAMIVPFRGEFYTLKPQVHHLCRNLIYPVPDPKFPFLGVHFTRMIDGSVECGPNAVLALAREGYRKRDINVRDLFESLTYRGFQKMAIKYWRTGMGEMWRSLSKRAFVKALQRLLPEIRAEHLERAPAGVRAQAIAADGQMIDDFVILQSDRIINVCNAPSPAATSSLNIGKLITERLADQL